MNDQHQNGDPKQGFGKTSDTENHQKTDNPNKKAIDDEKKAHEDKKRERREAIEDTSSNNYGNIGVEGGVEDLDEEG